MPETETPLRTLKELRAQYTMRISEVAEVFGVPVSTLRNMMQRGAISLSARRFGENTSPHLYDPVEVAAEAARHAAKVEGSE